MTIEDDIETLKQEQEDLEREAIKAILQIKVRVEEVTGRELALEMPIDENILCSLHPELELLPPTTPLSRWVSESAKIIRKNPKWTFASPCQFFDWARPYFERGWKEK